MDPTIYKPSIYKGAGIYKTGGTGGGGESTGVFNINYDDNTNNISPVNAAIEIKGNILKKRTGGNNSGLIYNAFPFYSCNEYKIKFSFKYDVNTSKYSQLLGGRGYFFRDPTIWRNPLEDNKNFALGLPDGSDSWNNILLLDCDIDSNSIYELEYIVNNITKNAQGKIYKDGELKDEKNKTFNNIDYSRHTPYTTMLTGGFDHKFIGELYLDKCSIYCDDVRYF